MVTCFMLTFNRKMVTLSGLTLPFYEPYRTYVGLMGKKDRMCNSYTSEVSHLVWDVMCAETYITYATREVRAVANHAG